MDKVGPLIQTAKCAINFVGEGNIIFFGLLTMAGGVYYMTPKNEQPKYYKFRLFKRIKPTKTISEKPYN